MPATSAEPGFRGHGPLLRLTLLQRRRVDEAFFIHLRGRMRGHGGSVERDPPYAGSPPTEWTRERPGRRSHAGAWERYGSAAAHVHETQHLHLAAGGELMARGFALQGGVNGVDHRLVAERMAA
ncbi:hypothetical protein D9M68_146990 [compost metagenome]